MIDEMRDVRKMKKVAAYLQELNMNAIIRSRVGLCPNRLRGGDTFVMLMTLIAWDNGYQGPPGSAMRGG